MHIRSFLPVTVGILALFAGKALNERVGLLGRYDIPEPVTDGLLFALAFTLAYFLLGIEVEFGLTAPARSPARSCHGSARCSST